MPKVRSYPAAQLPSLDQPLFQSNVGIASLGTARASILFKKMTPRFAPSPWSAIILFPLGREMSAATGRVQDNRVIPWR